MVDSQAFQMMPVSEGLVRAVWRARGGIHTNPRSPALKSPSRQWNWVGWAVLPPAATLGLNVDTCKEVPRRVRSVEP